MRLKSIKMEEILDFSEKLKLTGTKYLTTGRKIGLHFLIERAALNASMVYYSKSVGRPSKLQFDKSDIYKTPPRAYIAVHLNPLPIAVLCGTHEGSIGDLTDQPDVLRMHSNRSPILSVSDVSHCLRLSREVVKPYLRMWGIQEGGRIQSRPTHGETLWLKMKGVSHEAGSA